MTSTRLLAIAVLLLPTLLRAADQPNAAPGSTSGVKPMHPTAPNRITEQDAREWLARYQTAWRSSDVATLSALGVIHQTQEPALRKALAGYKHLDVSVSNENIELDGTRARVAFDRIDVDETGRSLKHPRHVVLLERVPSGVVSTWRSALASD
jgi:hypothetical protein